MTDPEPAHATSEAIRFPRLYVAIKWTIIASLIVLAVLAAAFWTLVLGQFAASGFRANPAAAVNENPVITPECAWPLDVNDHDAKAVCRMFYNLTPEQRARVLAKRK
jgi:flagellar basal body-associated protein FliL